MSIGVAASPDRDWGFLFSFLAGVMIAGALLSVAGYMIGHVMGRLAAAMFGNRFWRVALTGLPVLGLFYTNAFFYGHMDGFNLPTLLFVGGCLFFVLMGVAILKTAI